MNRKQCRELLELTDDCPKCKGKMEIAKENLIGGNYYYLNCPHCRTTFEE